MHLSVRVHGYMVLNHVFVVSTHRQMYLRLEASAERGERPAWELGPAAAEYSASLMTHMDHKNFVLEVSLCVCVVVFVCTWRL